MTLSRFETSVGTAETLGECDREWFDRGDEAVCAVVFQGVE